jgi:hypothetical protein
MTDETTQPPVDGQAPAGAPDATPTGEVEDWQKRMSGLQRAHNTETQVLRDQIAALQAAQSGTTAQASQQVAATSQEAANWKAQAEANAKALAEERQLRIVETRQAKYPFAAENLGDPGVLVAMDEARLAGLNERLAPPPAATRKGVMDANGAGRSVGSTDVPTSQKTAQQLKDDLTKFAPDWTRQLQEAQQGG